MNSWPTVRATWPDRDVAGPVSNQRTPAVTANVTSATPTPVSHAGAALTRQAIAGIVTAVWLAALDDGARRWKRARTRGAG